MFRPTKGICTGTHKHEGCGEEGIIMTNSRKLCQSCETKRKPKKGITKVTSKQRGKITDNKSFYETFILQHEKHTCDECDAPIPHPTGSNVSHIISGSTNEALYHDVRNAFLLCQTCEGIWSRSGTKNSRWSMKIWPEAQRRKTELLNEHYLQPLIRKRT